MNIPKLLLIGGVAVAAALFSPTAQAHDRDHDDHHRHADYRHHHGDFDRHYYHGDRRAVVYGYGSPYYADPTPGVTIAFGGHSHYRHWHHR